MSGLELHNLDELPTDDPKHRKQTGRPLFNEAVGTYLNIVRRKLNADVAIPIPSSGRSYTTRKNLIAATYARMAFTDREQEYFYNVYDELWEEGSYIEAYSLMRLVFGVFCKGNLEQLERKGHLLTYKRVNSYARGIGG